MSRRMLAWRPAVHSDVNNAAGVFLRTCNICTAGFGFLYKSTQTYKIEHDSSFPLLELAALLLTGQPGSSGRHSNDKHFPGFAWYLSYRYSEKTTSKPPEAFSHVGGTSSSPSEETGGGRKPSANRGKRRRRNPELDESQYETEYTTGGETGNELDDGEEWERWDQSLHDCAVASLCNSSPVWIKDGNVFI